MNIDFTGKKVYKEVIDWIFCILIAIILALLFRYFVGTPTVVKKTSMFPTLKENDRLILNRTIRISKKIPKRGEIITFEAPSKIKFESYEIDQNNPIAEYKNNFSNIFSEFAYNVLEFGKDSYIKRAIAFSGERVEIKNGKVYINNELLNEDYLDESVTTKSNVFNNFVVPEGYIFAMGDNRDGSNDCRNFGCIPIEKIEGIVVFRFFPLDELGSIK